MLLTPGSLHAVRIEVAPGSDFDGTFEIHFDATRR